MPTTQFSCDSIIVSVFWVERYFLPHIPFYKNQITVWTMTMQIHVHIHVHVHVPSIKHYSPNQKLTIFYMQRNQRGLLLLLIRWKLKRKNWIQNYSLGVYASFECFLFVDGRFKLSDRSESSECWPRGTDKGSPGLQPELPIQN